LRPALLIVLSATLAVPAAAQDADFGFTPQQIGEIFCMGRTAGDMAPVSGLLTPELAAVIAEAEAKDAAWAVANPGDKPPLGDGIPWSSAPDYAASCIAGAGQLMMDEASVEIAYGFPEYPAGNYSDWLNLRLVDDPATHLRVWRINDLAYDSGSQLSDVLSTIFAN
jgi:hypothetical protein